MNLQELRYCDPSPAVDWEYMQEPQRVGSSFALVNLARFVPPPTASSWRVTVEGQFCNLLKLERGWDGYNSGPISRAVAAFTRAILKSAMKPDTPAPTLVPTRGGGVQLEWHEQGLDIELMVYRP
ncbi:MAG: hypothetical protein E6G94_00085, partial [Alphaproteobacteria bacterium]